MKPMIIRTPRFIIRPPIPEDTKPMQRALQESFKELHTWMPWAREVPSLLATESYIEESIEIWESAPEEGTERPLQICELDNKTFIAATGIQPLNLEVPSFEIGYWVRKAYAKKGFVTQGSNALTRFLFDVYHANRVEMKVEVGNERSAKVPLRLGFELESTIHNHRLTADGKNLTHTQVYARFNLDNMPEQEYTWEPFEG